MKARAALALAAGKTQEEAAKIVNRSRATIARWLLEPAFVEGVRAGDAFLLEEDARAYVALRALSLRRQQEILAAPIAELTPESDRMVEDHNGELEPIAGVAANTMERVIFKTQDRSGLHAKFEVQRSDVAPTDDGPARPDADLDDADLDAELATINRKLRVIEGGLSDTPAAEAG